MVQGIRLGSKFEPGVLIIFRRICSIVIFAVWLAYSWIQLKKVLNPPIGYEYEKLPFSMYVPTLIVAGYGDELAGMDLLVGGFYANDPSKLQPIGSVEKVRNYLNGTMMAFIVTPYSGLRFGMLPSNNVQLLQSLAFALSTNSTSLPYYPSVSMVSAISATVNETIYMASLDPTRHSRIGLDQEITEDLQRASWTAYTAQKESLSLAFFSNYPYAGMLAPLKQPINNNDKWISQIRRMKPTYTWLDLLSSMGGTLPLVTGVYYFLFGVGRIQTWGVIQRYVLRRQVLSQVSESVLAVPNYSRVGGKISPVTQQSANEKDHFRVQMPMPMPMPGSSSTLDSRIAQLEAFQQRMDIFYLNHQLFSSKN